jgi:hypothetical protein
MMSLSPRAISREVTSTFILGCSSGATVAVKTLKEPE